MQTTRFNPSELCSRKLWQIVNSEQAGPLNSADLQRAISELAARRHYLTELAEMGKLGDSSHQL